MKIIEILLHDIVSYGVVPANMGVLLENLKLTKSLGVLTPNVVRIYANSGIPIIAILKGVLRKDPREIVALIESGNILYDDFICSIAIYAQELKRESQIRTRYGTEQHN
jgi:hypothetical protein